LMNTIVKKIILVTPGEWNHNGLTRVAQSQIWAVVKYLVKHGHIGKSFAVRVLNDSTKNPFDTAESLVWHLQRECLGLSHDVDIYNNITELPPITFKDLKDDLRGNHATKFESIIVALPREKAKSFVNQDLKDFIQVGIKTEHFHNISVYMIDEKAKHIECFYSNWGTPEPIIAE